MKTGQNQVQVSKEEGYIVIKMPRDLNEKKIRIKLDEDKYMTIILESSKFDKIRELVEMNIYKVVRTREIIRKLKIKKAELVKILIDAVNRGEKFYPLVCGSRGYYFVISFDPEKAKYYAMFNGCKELNYKLFFAMYDGLDRIKELKVPSSKQRQPRREISLDDLKRLAEENEYKVVKLSKARRKLRVSKRELINILLKSYGREKFYCIITRHNSYYVGFDEYLAYHFARVVGGKVVNFNMFLSIWTRLDKRKSNPLP